MQNTTNKKRIAILGSTGSIGIQALEVIKNNPKIFEIEVLTANNNAKLLIKQAIEYKPNFVVIGNANYYNEVKEALEPLFIKVFAGYDAIDQIVEISTVDVVLAAIVGCGGLSPVYKAILAGKEIALANKETLVVAGELIMQLAKEKGVRILPVDSEHSAIFQCLEGEMHNKIEKIILTASGGPFRGKDVEFLKTVNASQALNHPNWNMGAKITIDSASLMNKGLEVIEAMWLFNLKPDQVEVIVHHQSIIHSLVQFSDGSIKAQLGLPDMKLPIQYALTYPYRVKTCFPRFNFLNYPNLTFEQADLKTFKCLNIAYQAIKLGGSAPCIMNAANEIAVDYFLNEKITFLQIPEFIENALSISEIYHPKSIEEYIEIDKQTRIITKKIINK